VGKFERHFLTRLPSYDHQIYCIGAPDDCHVTRSIRALILPFFGQAMRQILEKNGRMSARIDRVTLGLPDFQSRNTWDFVTIASLSLCRPRQTSVQCSPGAQQETRATYCTERFRTISDRMDAILLPVQPYFQRVLAAKTTGFLHATQHNKIATSLYNVLRSANRPQVGGTRHWHC